MRLLIGLAICLLAFADAQNDAASIMELGADSTDTDGAGGFFSALTTSGSMTMMQV